MALRLDLSPGDVIRIGTGTVLRVEAKSGNRTRVSIDSEYRVVKEPRGSEPPVPAPAGQPPKPVVTRPR